MKKELVFLIDFLQNFLCTLQLLRILQEIKETAGNDGNMIDKDFQKVNFVKNDYG